MSSTPESAVLCASPKSVHSRGRQWLWGEAAGAAGVQLCWCATVADAARRSGCPQHSAHGTINMGLRNNPASCGVPAHTVHEVGVDSDCCCWLSADKTPQRTCGLCILSCTSTSSTRTCPHHPAHAACAYTEQHGCAGLPAATYSECGTASCLCPNTDIHSAGCSRILVPATQNQHQSTHTQQQQPAMGSLVVMTACVQSQHT